MNIPRKLSSDEMRGIMLPPHSEASIKALASAGYAQLEAGEVFTVQSKSEFVALVRGAR